MNGLYMVVDSSDNSYVLTYTLYPSVVTNLLNKVRSVLVVRSNEEVVGELSTRVKCLLFCLNLFILLNILQCIEYSPCLTFRWT